MRVRARVRVSVRVSARVRARVGVGVTWPSAARQKLTTAKESGEAAAAVREARKLSCVTVRVRT